MKPDDLIKKLNIYETDQPLSSGGELTSTVRNSIADVLNKAAGIDPNFDQSGIDSWGFRAGFSRMDNEEERVNYLKSTVGPDGFTKDRYNNYALTTKGMDKLGLPHKNKPVLIDAPYPELADIADLRGSAGPIAGGAIGGMLGGPYGAAAGIGLAALGAAGGKGIDEAADALRGQNLQSPSEVAGDIASEGGYAAAGEGLYRGVMRPIGRKLMAPHANRVTPEARQLVKESMDIGARPNVTQVTKAPILGRAQSMMNRIFGDPTAAQNATALNKEMARLKLSVGRNVSKKTVGEAITGDIKRTRGAVSRLAARRYGLINEAIQGKPIVPTQGLKQQATEILQSFPKGKEGQTLFINSDIARHLTQIDQLPDNITISEMQAIRQQLWDSVSDNTILPGMPSRYARMLYKETNKAFENVGGDQQVAQALKLANNEYAKNIRRFDDAFISRVMKDPSYAGSIPPEKVVGSVFRKGEESKLNRLMQMVKPKTRESIRRSAMDDLLSNISERTDDPLKEVFNGKKFLNTLDSYGEGTLKAMFGEQKTKELYRFGRVAQFVNQKMAMSGGIVAAGIALHPWQNLGRLIKLNLLSKFLNSDFGLKWMTIGLEAPKTRAGAAAISRISAQASILARDHTNETEDKPTQPNE